MRLTGKKVYRRQSLIKKISLISLAGFLLVIVAGAFSYNDKSLLFYVLEIDAFARAGGSKSFCSRGSHSYSSPSSQSKSTTRSSRQVTTATSPSPGGQHNRTSQVRRIRDLHPSCGELSLAVISNQPTRIIAKSG
jgi:hypothetical protein